MVVEDESCRKSRRGLGTCRVVHLIETNFTTTYTTKTASSHGTLTHQNLNHRQLPTSNRSPRYLGQTLPIRQTGIRRPCQRKPSLAPTASPQHTECSNFLAFPWVVDAPLPLSRRCHKSILQSAIILSILEIESSHVTRLSGYMESRP